MMQQLVVEQVGQYFGRRVLFRGLSFEVTGGGAWAITGANGSGKSTLLRILAGVLKPSKGRIRLQVDGRAVPDEERPLYTGLVAPYLNVYDGLSAYENLHFLTRARALSTPVVRIERMLELVALRDRAHDLVSTYSSGMKQRVKFAAALLADPPLLLLDEPSTNLDEAGQAMVRRVIDYQKAQGRLLVLATNDTREAALCDTALRIEAYR